MPLDRLVLILVAVIFAAGATLWIVLALGATFASPGLGLIVLIPSGLILFIIIRVIADRVGNAEDDHYDGIEK